MNFPFCPLHNHMLKYLGSIRFLFLFKLSFLFINFASTGCFGVGIPGRIVVEDPLLALRGASEYNVNFNFGWADKYSEGYAWLVLANNTDEKTCLPISIPTELQSYDSVTEKNHNSVNAVLQSSGGFSSSQHEDDKGAQIGLAGLRNHNRTSAIEDTITISDGTDDVFDRFLGRRRSDSVSSIGLADHWSNRNALHGRLPTVWVYELSLDICPVNMTSLIQYAHKHGVKAIAFGEGKLSRIHTEAELTPIVTAAEASMISSFISILMTDSCKNNLAHRCLKLWLDQCPPGMRYLNCATGRTMSIIDSSVFLPLWFTLSVICGIHIYQHERNLSEMREIVNSQNAMHDNHSLNRLLMIVVIFRSIICGLSIMLWLVFPQDWYGSQSSQYVVTAYMCVFTAYQTGFFGVLCLLTKGYRITRSRPFSRDETMIITALLGTVYVIYCADYVEPTFVLPILTITLLIVWSYLVYASLINIQSMRKKIKIMTSRMNRRTRRTLRSRRRAQTSQGTSPAPGVSRVPGASSGVSPALGASPAQRPSAGSASQLVSPSLGPSRRASPNLTPNLNRSSSPANRSPIQRTPLLADQFRSSPVGEGSASQPSTPNLGRPPGPGPGRNQSRNPLLEMDSVVEVPLRQQQYDSMDIAQPNASFSPPSEISAYKLVINGLRVKLATFYILIILASICVVSRIIFACLQSLTFNSILWLLGCICTELCDLILMILVVFLFRPRKETLLDLGITFRTASSDGNNVLYQVERNDSANLRREPSVPWFQCSSMIEIPSGAMARLDGGLDWRTTTAALRNKYGEIHRVQQDASLEGDLPQRNSLPAATDPSSVPAMAPSNSRGSLQSGDSVVVSEPDVDEFDLKGEKDRTESSNPGDSTDASNAGEFAVGSSSSTSGELTVGSSSTRSSSKTSEDGLREDVAGTASSSSSSSRAPPPYDSRSSTSSRGANGPGNSVDQSTSSATQAPFRSSSTQPIASYAASPSIPRSPTQESGFSDDSFLDEQEVTLTVYPEPILIAQPTQDLCEYAGRCGLVMLGVLDVEEADPNWSTVTLQHHFY